MYSTFNSQGAKAVPPLSVPALDSRNHITTQSSDLIEYCDLVDDKPRRLL
jgi:hypothetical protein